VPVILISTSELLLTKAQDEHALWGGDRYLLKPFDLGELLTMIQNLIGPA
jgi:DNA-binding response OmpR family regulator